MKNKTKHFWKWFLEHKSKLKNLTTLNHKEQRHYTFWLDWHLQFYFPGLEYIIVFPKVKKKKTKLILSARGKQELFSMAIELEKTAPRLWDWKFTALIQPRQDIDDIEAGKDEPYIFQDIILKASELKFIPFEYDGEKKIDMIVYLKNYTIFSHNKNLPTLINIMMQDLLGEKVMAENINFVQLAQMPSEENDELIYLYDLQFYLDDINKNRKSD
ncbi:hypothetical protein [Flavobacterium wongokense]|uniref:hypothetical protein n=1 Tax=Flavobacterium wongokense TaxID=2910674 RepID=UPI001F2FD05B|nr:hypothetical protein [Flavobacterium sp. WG47]MCF6132757.1 hypothetical protein [Flavobacterium sp. WG47]